MSDELAKIGLRVRLLREMDGLTQGRLAELVGVTRATINYLEKGRGQTRMGTLEAVAGMLETTVGVLLGSEPMPPGSTVPGIRLETQYVVTCGVCGRLDTLNDMAAAERLRTAHRVPHPPSIFPSD